ncbi:MAG: ArnT family glycosyltransferase [Brevefilum sp.]
MISKNKRHFTQSNFAVPMFLLVLCVLAYGLLIPTLGYYWDDWPYAWINHMYGPSGYPEFVSLDRPHSAWIFMLLTSLLDEGPLGYHISSLLLFWLCAVLFWALIRQLWPAHRKEAFWAALLFAVYPGFLGHPQAIIYNHHFAAMALVLFSFIGMVKGIQASGEKGNFLQSAAWHLPAIAAMVLSQFTIEYFLGWEAVRLLVAWVAQNPQKLDLNRRAGRIIIHVYPYILATLCFLIWRVFIFQFPTYQPVGAGEAEFVLHDWLISTVIQFLETVFAAWIRAFPRLSSGDFGRIFWLSYLILTAGATILVFSAVLLYHKKRSPEDGMAIGGPEKFGGQVLFISLVGLAFAGWPFWLADLNININSPFHSRFTMAFIPWVALFLTAFYYWFSKIRACGVHVLNLIVISVLVGGSAGYHYWNANFYRNEWLVTQRYFQQMVHRIPDLTPGTSLVINDLRALSLYQDDSLTAIMNWTYSPENTDKSMDYMVQYLSVRLGREIPALEPGLTIKHPYRSLQFTGTTDQLLVVYYQPPGCLRVLDYDHPDRLPIEFPIAMIPALPLSKPELIRTDVEERATPPLHLFDETESETWCLYFQDADLAAQREDWEEVASLGDHAFELDDQSNEVSELFVFIEGYLRVGRFDRAEDLSEVLSERSARHYDEAICNLWREVEPELNQSVDFNAVYDRFCDTE